MPKWLTEIRGRVPLGAAIALGVVPIVVMAGLWFWLTSGPVEERHVSPTILPSPAEVARSVPDLLKRDLWLNTWASLKRVSLGFLIGIAVAVPIGIFMGSFGSARAVFNPVMTASGYIPIATLVPLTMSWWGTDEKQKILFLAMAFGIYLLPLTVKAIDGVSEVYLRTAYTLGATKWQAIRRVLVPIALPDIWHGMRLAFGVGWTYLVLTEALVIVDGLGALVQMSQRRGPREHIYLVIVVITIVAWVFDLVWERIGQVLFPYKRRPA